MNREVLLIEDDPAYRASISYLFGDEPYRFVEAESPEAGIAILEANPQLRVILLDLSFGHSAGTVVLDHIRERSDDYRVIVLTGRDDLLNAEQAGEYAVFNYLPKAEKSAKQAIRFSLDQAFKDIERAHLAQKVETLLEVQNQITAGHALEDTLNLICRSVRSVVGAYTCHIRVYDFTRGDYHLAGFAGPSDQLRNLFDRPKAKGDDFSGLAIKETQAQNFGDLQSMEEFRRFAAEALARPEVTPAEERYFLTARSAYIVPISTGLFDAAVDAVLNVSGESMDFFDAARCALVDEFVTQAALTITKDWLQRKREEIHSDYSQISRMLSEITNSLKGKDVLAEIYEVVTKRISEIVNPEVISIFLYNEMTGLLENVAERGSEPVDALNELYRPGQSLTGAVFQSEGTILLPQPGDKERIKPLEDPRYDHSGKEGYLSIIPSGDLEHYLGVPIRMGGKVRGVLRAMNKKSNYYNEASARHNRLCLLERGFSKDCRNVMEITASHLAVAIRNAELLDEKGRQFERVQTLGEVGRLINSALDIEELLNLTLHKMAEVMQAEICMLFLREGEDRIVLKQSFGMPIIPDAFYQIGHSVTGRVAETGQAQLIGKTRENDGKYDSDIRQFLWVKHGEPKDIESLMVVPIIAKGTVLGVMKVINKIGDHHQYSESDLEVFQTFADYVGVAMENAQVYKHLSLLVSSVAHEINNTSGVIPANVAGIKAQLGAPSERISRMLALIEDSARQATEFANELAGFSANRVGGKRPLNINEVIRNAVDGIDLTKHGVPESISLDISLSPRPIFCEIYERPFAQIVRNIVINAFQALEGKPGGAVRVSSSKSTGEAPGTAVLRFEDNGPGIKLEHRSRIFDGDFTTKPKGNGLGLWLVRRQLEVVGGTIEVESEPGEGACFIVKLPLARNGGKLPNEASSPNSNR